MTIINKYKELSKFNITRLIESFHNDGIVLSKEFFENLNVHERSKHNFMLNNEVRFIDETVAINFITNLSFEIYKPYINHSWVINKDLNNNMIDQFNYHGTYEFLDYLLDICIKENETISPLFKNRTDKESQFYNKYNNDFLNMLINFERLVDRDQTKEEVNNNFKLFKKALKEKFLYAEIQRNLILEENETSKQYNTENWFKHYNYIKGFNGSNLEIKDFINRLVMQPQKSDIFFDIMKQYKNESNPFLKKEVFALAFKEQNNEVVTYLSPYISQEDKIAVFYDICKEWNNNTARNIYQCIIEEKYFENKKDVMHGGKINFIKWYIDTIQKIVPEHEIEWDRTGYIFLNINEKYFNELLEKNPKIKQINLIDNYNLDYFKIAINTFNDFVESYGYKEDYKLNEEIKYQYIMHLSEIYKPEKNMLLERNNIIKSFIIDNLLRRNPDKNFEDFWEIVNFSEELDNKTPNKASLNNKKKI